MRKSLSTIQSLAKLGKVLSNIVFVVSIVCTIIFAIAAVLLYLGSQETAVLNGFDVQSIVANASEYSTDEILVMSICGFFSCLFEAILSKAAVRYFKTQLTAATPFTTTCAKRMKRLGILTIVLPIVGIVLGTAAAVFLVGFDPEVIPAYYDVTGSTSISLGVMFLILAVVFKYGTEILWEKTSTVAASDTVPQFDIISRGAQESDATPDEDLPDGDLIRGFKSFAISDMEQEIAAKVERGFGPGASGIIKDAPAPAETVSEPVFETIDASVFDMADDFPADGEAAAEEVFEAADDFVSEVSASDDIPEFDEAVEEITDEAPAAETIEEADDFLTRFKNEFGGSEN